MIIKLAFQLLKELQSMVMDLLSVVMIFQEYSTYLEVMSSLKT